MTDYIGKRLSDIDTEGITVKLVNSDVDGEYYVVRQTEEDGVLTLTACRFSMKPSSI